VPRRTTRSDPEFLSLTLILSSAVAIRAGYVRKHRIGEEAVILAIVSSDHAFYSDVRAALDGRFQFEAVWDLTYEDTARLLGVKSDHKCLTIIDFTAQVHAMTLAGKLSGRAHITTIGVNSGSSREELLQLMQAGVRDVLPQLTSRDLLQAASRALAVLGVAGEIVADVYAFVPAKPGCGATTVATHASGMASRLTEEPVLLLDYDIRLGLTTFLLKAAATRTIVDALEQVKRLDRDLWSGLVLQIGNLHLLGSGAADFSRAFPAQDFMELLDFAVRQYSVVAVDLPGSMEDYECDVLLRSKRILLVCTPDIGALHVARRKSQWFQDLRLTERVAVVLNCVDRRSTLSVKDIERIIQLPVTYLLPAATKDISKAVQKGEILDPACRLGRELAAIAGDMVPAKSAAQKPSPVRRFVDYFSVSPARDARGTRIA
jgi:pilus assembly protein CpaE